VNVHIILSFSREETFLSEKTDKSLQQNNYS